ncbi:MAG: hypothetical protein IKV94_02490 [Clostridia bacterium]|nr:hypothetical protein [Clostridia bacterium]MBR6517116.1 hypothetical protein [Bacilli bacterium]
MNKEVVKIGRYIEFEHENGICENILLLTEKETNAMEKQLKKSYEYEQQISQLTNNWNELEEWLKADYKELYRDAGYRHNIIREILDKMKEIKERNNENKT